jgi:hypothetical protein
MYALSNPLLYAPVDLDLDQIKNVYTVHEQIQTIKQCLLCARAFRYGTARVRGTRPYTEKKKIKFTSYIGKFRVEQLQSHI